MRVRIQQTRGNLRMETGRDEETISICEESCCCQVNCDCPVETGGAGPIGERLMAILLEPGCLARKIRIPPSDVMLRRTVGGSMRISHPFEPGICLIENPDSEFIGCMPNRAIYAEDVRTDWRRFCAAGEQGNWETDRCSVQERRLRILRILTGPCLICGFQAGKVMGLSEDQEKRYLNRFLFPEQFYLIEGRLTGISYDPRVHEYHNLL